ncbi:HK97 family phage prohead protease [Longispora albida]|uniref:HK97 family phage prohead protease n=1 Tax=Longispora albida TaxID=203523 RepID=UPI00037F3390|nr:HK97 family phage prohead protease [Longispora albida]
MLLKTCRARIKQAGGPEAPAGEFEAIVSVFGNVDSVGDKVMPGAFTDTLAEWEASGDPIPIIWSHRSDDPDYHIGHVIEAAETGEGLWVRGLLDLDAPKAAQVYRLLKGRRVTQFSFAYDILDAAPGVHEGADVLELRKLKVYEVGPTLIGANQATSLLAVKEGRRNSTTDLADLQHMHDAAVRLGAACQSKAIHGHAPDTEEPARVKVLPRPRRDTAAELALDLALDAA